jgi:hypothetical protein
MAKRWYIVHAYSNFENKVAQSLKDQAAQRNLSDKFDEILVPTEKVVEVRRGRKVDAERKFFPGYVLVKCDLTDEVYHLIKNTPKVTGFLGDQGPVGRGRRAPEAHDQLRDRRAGARRRRAFRLLQRRRRGRRRRPRPREGRGLDLRPGDPGRAGIRAGREGLTLLPSSSGGATRRLEELRTRGAPAAA